MVLMDIYDIYSYFMITTDGLMNILVLVLLIVVINSNLKKELGPDCKKGFSNFFIAFLVFLMFSTFFDFAYSLTYKIISDLIEAGEMDHSTYWTIIPIISIAKFWLDFLNTWNAFILLFSSMEIYLFYKKSHWKFMILAIILQIGTFLLFILNIVIGGLLNFMGSFITQLIVDILINFNYIIIGIVILICGYNIITAVI